MTTRPVNIVRPYSDNDSSEEENNPQQQLVGERRDGSDSESGEQQTPRGWRRINPPSLPNGRGRGRLLLEPEREMEREEQRRINRERQRRPRFRRLRNGQRRIRTPSPPFLLADEMRRPWFDRSAPMPILTARGSYDNWREITIRGYYANIASLYFQTQFILRRVNRAQAVARARGFLIEEEEIEEENEERD